MGWLASEEGEITVVQDIWWIWCWAISGSWQPNMITCSVNGLNGRNVTAEAVLSKVVVGSEGGSAKAAVWHSTEYGGRGYSTNYGIDGSPIRFIPSCNYMSFALEVRGPATFAWMTGKLFVH